ncbi:MAG TPA: molecular chaperone SurA [Chromatiales bacterium]|nr:molecular chaperone SurA [Thiotrichales bacterium]HIP68580.1 molecular chaperone SurA [Chromatiales bacterium]
MMKAVISTSWVAWNMKAAAGKRGWLDSAMSQMMKTNIMTTYPCNWFSKGSPHLEKGHNCCRNALQVMKQMMNKIFPLLILLATSAVQAEVQWLDRIVAIAGDDVVTQLELQKEGMTIQRELQARKTPLPARDVFIRQVLERLVVKKLQLQRAHDRGIRIDDAELNRAISKVASKNRMSLSQFRQALIQEGINYASFRKDIRDELMISQLRKREVERNIRVSEQEVEDFLKQQDLGGNNQSAYRISHILITLPEAATPEQLQAAKNKAESVRKKAEEGADFARLAVAHSDGQKALEGGDLGWREGNQLPTIFADTVLQMQPGQISKPIRSVSGFHIVKLVDKKESTAGTVTETRARHILMKGEKAREKLENLREQIQQGADFAQLAKQNSLDKGSAKQGGDLGWAGPGKFVPAFENAINQLKPGEISPPFQSAFGWHIVQVMARRDAPISQELLQSKAREFLLKQKQEEAELLWLRRLRDEAYVEYRIPGMKG